MPIYAYKCSACGFAKDVLQKMSDTPLTVCLSCGAETFTKQLTAAGFQLKGSGWYVTDFRDGGGKKAADKDGNAGAESTGDQSPDKAGVTSADAPAPAAPAESAKAAPAAAPASAPAPAAAAKSD